MWGTGIPGGEKFKAALTSPSSMGHLGLSSREAKAQNTGPELNHLYWPRCPECGRGLNSKAAEQRRDKGEPGVALAAAWLLRPASLLHLAATPGAAEEGAVRVEDAGTQGHLSPTHTHFQDGLLGIRPSPSSLFL